MGAAMAPSAIDTLTSFFVETKTKPQDYDLIATGDLGYEGHRIVKELMYECGYDMGLNYKDCGLMIYDRKRQDMHSGGSGCGCSAVVFASDIYDELCNGKLNNVLFLGTGALMHALRNGFRYKRGRPRQGIHRSPSEGRKARCTPRRR